MLKSILMGGAMLLAIPALAQTTGTNTSQTGSNSSQTGTTTNDHEPMETDDQGTAATGTMGTGSQVNGGVMSSSPGAHAGHSTGTQGTTSGQAGNWSGTTGTTTGSGTMGTGTAGAGMKTEGGAMGTGTTAGAGGPFQAARSYPPCTRTRTDSCRQRGGR